MEENFNLLTIDEKYLSEYWEKYFGIDSNAEIVFAKLVFLRGVKKIFSDEGAVGVLHLKSGGIKFEVKASLAKSLLLTPFIASIMQYTGTTNIPANVLLALLPILFEIKNAKVSNYENEIRLSLPIQKHNGNFLSAEKWYLELPTNLQRNLTLGQFKDFLETLVYAGLAKANSKGKYMIFAKDKRIFKISFV
jgi:hypothetical protein